jgi:hypothetical protein
MGIVLAGRGVISRSAGELNWKQWLEKHAASCSWGILSNRIWSWLVFIWVWDEWVGLALQWRHSRHRPPKSRTAQESHLNNLLSRNTKPNGKGKYLRLPLSTAPIHCWYRDDVLHAYRKLHICHFLYTVISKFTVELLIILCSRARQRS